MEQKESNTKVEQFLLSSIPKMWLFETKSANFNEVLGNCSAKSFPYPSYSVSVLLVQEVCTTLYWQLTWTSNQWYRAPKFPRLTPMIYFFKRYLSLFTSIWFLFLFRRGAWHYWLRQTIVTTKLNPFCMQLRTIVVHIRMYRPVNNPSILSEGMRCWDARLSQVAILKVIVGWIW